MSDDLDDLLRRAMKTLDDQVPSGYFDTFPDQALSRLEAPMHSTGTGSMERDARDDAPPAAAREENSGLHDIRSLAQSTKQRLSSKRLTTEPPVSEDDLLASSSAGWKAVALPEPAKMVSLPELGELPSKREVIAKEKAAEKAAKEAAKQAASAEARPAPRIEARPAAPASAAPVPAARPARPAARRPVRAFAIGGVVLAAAAGAAIFLATRGGEQTASSSNATVAQVTPAPAPAATAPPPPPPAAPPATAAPVAAPAAGSTETTPPAAPAEVQAAGATADDSEAEATRDVRHKAQVTRGHHRAAEHARKTDHAAAEKDEATGDKPAGDKKTGSNGEPAESFDQLLKEAGVADTKYETKPKLSRKSLSADDFKHGMDAVSAKAQACYKGTQGLASIKLVIAPSGKVSRVSVTGAFAGKPEGACVQAAVKHATFPAWDGGPQTFRYSYLLAE